MRSVMSLKLTLRIDPLLIQQAKDYAKQHNRSVSQIVSDYFSLLHTQIKKTIASPSLPISHSLRGVLKKTDLNQQDYQQYLEDKYL